MLASVLLWLFVAQSTATSAAQALIKQAQADVDARLAKLSRDVSQVISGGCTYDIGTSVASIPYNAGTLTVSVQTAGACAWTLTSQVSWLHNLSATSGTGPLQVTMTVDTNTAAQRSGTLTLTGTTLVTPFSKLLTITEAIGLPGQASNPQPSSGASGVSTAPNLTWSAATLASSYNVYFGVTLSFKQNITNLTYVPGTLTNGTTYQWRIDAVNASGVTAGPVWTFTVSANNQTTYYVQPGGSGTTCAQAQNIATPLPTIGQGIGCPTAGQLLYIRAGTYNEAINDGLNGGTAWGTTTQVTISAYPNETVTLAPNNVGNCYALYLSLSAEKFIEFDNININATNVACESVNITSNDGIGDPNHIRFNGGEWQSSGASLSGVLVSTALSASAAVGANEFLNLKIHGGGGNNDFNHGMYIQTQNNLIDGCEVYDQPGAGVQFNGLNSPFVPTNNILRNSNIHDLRNTVAGQRHWGVILGDQSTGTLIYNNTISQIPSNGAAARGIDDFNAVNSVIVFNSIYTCGDIGIFTETNSSGASIENNVVNGCPTPISNGGGSSLTTNFTNAVSATSLWVSPSTGNFHLAGGSPLIGAGTFLASVTSDKDHKNRPNPPAIGPYEP